MIKLNIAVDLDGVIWDIMGIFLEIYNKKFKTNIKIEEVVNWYFFPQENFEAIYPDTLKRIDEYPILDENLKHYLFLLMGEHEVKILTKEQNPIEVIKKKLESFNIREGFEYLEVIKLEIKDKKVNYDFDIYIDDCPLMIEDIKEHPDKILLLFDQPWNRYCEETENVFKVRNWKDVMERIGEITNAT